MGFQSVLQRESATGNLAIEKPGAEANVFMSMVVGGPVSSLVLGLGLSREEIDKRVRFAVRQYLDGARPR